MIFSKITCIPITSQIWWSCKVTSLCGKLVQQRSWGKNFTVNLRVSLYLSFLFNFIEKTGLNYILPNSRFHQIFPLTKSSSRKPQWRKIVYILHVDKLASVFTDKLGLCFSGVIEWRPLQFELKQASSFRQPFLPKRTRLYCREWSLRNMKGWEKSWRPTLCAASVGMHRHVTSRNQDTFSK